MRGRTYAFTGLERIGGVMMYDVTDPRAPVFIDYVNDRNSPSPSVAAAAGVLGPERITFISAKDSPTGAPLVSVANEVSGTTSLWSVDRVEHSTR